MSGVPGSFVPRMDLVMISPSGHSAKLSLMYSIDSVMFNAFVCIVVMQVSRTQKAAKHIYWFNIGFPCWIFAILAIYWEKTWIPCTIIGTYTFLGGQCSASITAARRWWIYWFSSYLCSLDEAG
jgi:hypothetical protein